jgi:uncharacterized membrane protein YbhN (UPF0104 family)
VKPVGWAWVRLLGALAVLAVIVWRVGTGPFVDGIRTISAWEVVAALAITAVTTASSAWRWRVVAARLDISLTRSNAIARYYRSLFLNSALPGGVVGDVHRSISHGRDEHDIGRAVRAVVWERTAGQVVQGGLALLVLLVLPSPVRSSMPWVVAAVAAGIAVIAFAIKFGPHVIRTDIRTALLDRRAWPSITGASAIAVTGYTSLFVIAAHASVPEVSVVRMVPLAMLVLVAMTVPLSVAGWGPREGAAAWVFGAAGLGAGNGVAAATAYGVLSFIATLPGAVLLLGDWLRRRTSVQPMRELQGAAHG